VLDPLARLAEAATRAVGIIYGTDWPRARRFA